MGQSVLGSGCGGWKIGVLQCIVAVCSHFSLTAAEGRHQNQVLCLRGGSGHQGSDLNAKDPSGIWSSFQRIGSDEQGGVGAGLRTISGVWGQASCKRRSQPSTIFRLISDPRDDLVAVCSGTSFCGDAQATVKVPLAACSDTPHILKGTCELEPGHYRFHFEKSGEAEVLQGMWGVEDHRPLTVLPAPSKDAMLLMSDIDGTLIGDQDATDKFFWIWNEQYRPRGSHLVYNTGRPFPSAHNLIKENRLLPPTALVCSEGTEIYWFGPGGAHDVEPDYEWREILMLSWDYPKIKAGVQAVIDMMRHEINEAMYLPEMNGQPMIVISVPDKGKADNIIGKINHEVRHSKSLAFDMSCSSGGGNFFILIIPKGASKGSAALHVSKRLGFSADRVMVAGDGENDVPLFEATKEGFKGAIVGNAVDGLKKWVDRSPSRHMIHRSMSQQALGVLEGLERHFPKPS